MPERDVSSTIDLSFASLPLDVNTNGPAAVDPNSSISSISVSTVDKTLTVFKDTDANIQPDSINYSQNATNIPILALVMDNLEASQFDTVIVDSMIFTLRNGTNPNEILDQPQNYLRNIRILNKDQYRQSFAKLTNVPQDFAEYSLSGSESDSIMVRFNLSELILNPDGSDTLLMIVDLNPNAPNISFNFKVENVYAYLKTDDGSRDNIVRVIDQFGTRFADSDEGLSSIVSVVSANEEDKFSNYPNPFGQDADITRFAFFAEQSGNVQIRIYTLMGGLVRTLDGGSVQAQQFYSGRISWDGKNETGRTVLNGVYIAVLSIDGSSYYKTKVAFIK
jgi:hypothetical protein